MLFGLFGLLFARTSMLQGMPSYPADEVPTRYRGMYVGRKGDFKIELTDRSYRVQRQSSPAEGNHAHSAFSEWGHVIYRARSLRFLRSQQFKSRTKADSNGAGNFQESLTMANLASRKGGYEILFASESLRRNQDAEPLPRDTTPSWDEPSIRLGVVGPVEMKTLQHDLEQSGTPLVQVTESRLQSVMIVAPKSKVGEARRFLRMFLRGKSYQLLPDRIE